MDSADEDSGEGVSIPLEGSGNNQVAARKRLRRATRERRLSHHGKGKSFVEVNLRARKIVIFDRVNIHDIFQYILMLFVLIAIFSYFHQLSTYLLFLIF